MTLNYRAISCEGRIEACDSLLASRVFVTEQHVQSVGDVMDVDGKAGQESDETALKDAVRCM